MYVGNCLNQKVKLMNFVKDAGLKKQEKVGENLSKNQECPNPNKSLYPLTIKA